MGIPDVQEDALFDLAGSVISSVVKDNFEYGSTILDVGAGWGKYGQLLLGYKVDACEIWPPYYDTLRKIYNKVFIKDICDLEFDYYDVIILSDVLEHIERPRANELINGLVKKCKQLYVCVPYQYPQGAHEGNPYEKHLQDDLTPGIMMSEYPKLKPLLITKKRGIYIK